jgi:hypothetical protein
MPISSQSLVQPIKIESNIYFKVVASLFREWESQPDFSGFSLIYVICGKKSI